jgi:hypothetical protein
MDVAAYIDGLFEDEIRGWVVDVEQPDRIVTVCLRINGTFAGKVSACQYRPDLMPLFESGGIHGFAFRVPNRFFNAKAWNVEVLLEDGRHLGPRPLEIASPAAARGLPIRVRSPCLLFIHIPKTAGTALRSALTQHNRLSRHLLLYPNAPGFPGESIFFLTESQLANLEYVYGHFGFRLHQFIPQQCEYATVLREPVARTLSHFMQITRTANQAATISLDEFFSQPLTVDFDNLMTRLISGQTGDILPVGEVNEHVFEHAIDNLQ